MKNINKLLLIANVILCGVIISSFTMREKSIDKTIIAPGGNEGNVADRSAAQKLYGDFTRQYTAEAFPQHGGQISKTVLQNLLSKMTNANDTKVFYIFSRTADEKNCIMLFNDPAYNDINTAAKYVTSAPFCPDDCNQAVMQFVGE